jgi:hypothetical protein
VDSTIHQVDEKTPNRKIIPFETTLPNLNHVILVLLQELPKHLLVPALRVSDDVVVIFERADKLDREILRDSNVLIQIRSNKQSNPIK